MKPCGCLLVAPVLAYNHSPSLPLPPPPLAGIVTVIGLHLSVAIVLQFCSSVSPAPASLTRLYGVVEMRVSFEWSRHEESGGRLRRRIM